MNKVLTVVTGASGHVGNNLVRALIAEGRAVRVLVHRNIAALKDLNVEQVAGDVRDIDSLNHAFQGADVVYHVAGLVSIDDDCWPKVESVNVSGVDNVVSACFKAGVKRLVHFSSIHAIDQRPYNKPVDESRPLTGSSHPPYDRSKAAGEMIVLNGVSRGLNAVIVAPTGIIGPFDFQPSHTGQMLLSLARGRLPILVDGGFDWVDVRDVVAGAIHAESKGARGNKYILSGRWASLAELAKIVTKTGDVKAPALICPWWLANLCVPFATAYERLRHERPLYTRASLKAVSSNKATSHTRAAADLGYKPRPLEATVDDTLRWFKENGYLS